MTYLIYAVMYLGLTSSTFGMMTDSPEQSNIRLNHVASADLINAIKESCYDFHKKYFEEIEWSNKSKIIDEIKCLNNYVLKLKGKSVDSTKNCSKLAEPLDKLKYESVLKLTFKIGRYLSEPESTCKSSSPQELTLDKNFLTQPILTLFEGDVLDLTQKPTYLENGDVVFEARDGLIYPYHSLVVEPKSEYHDKKDTTITIYDATGGRIAGSRATTLSSFQSNNNMIVYRFKNKKMAANVIEMSRWYNDASYSGGKAIKCGINSVFNPYGKLDARDTFEYQNKLLKMILEWIISDGKPEIPLLGVYEEVCSTYTGNTLALAAMKTILDDHATIKSQFIKNIKDDQDVLQTIMPNRQNLETWIKARDKVETQIKKQDADILRWTLNSNEASDYLKKMAESEKKKLSNEINSIDSKIDELRESTRRTLDHLALGILIDPKFQTVKEMFNLVRRQSPRPPSKIYSTNFDGMTPPHLLGTLAVLANDFCPEPISP